MVCGAPHRKGTALHYEGAIARLVLYRVQRSERWYILPRRLPTPLHPEDQWYLSRATG